MTNKFIYLYVIQQIYAGYWEDADEYNTGNGEEMKAWRHDIKEYRLMGYPTRTIERRVPNTVTV